MFARYLFSGAQSEVGRWGMEDDNNISIITNEQLDGQARIIETVSVRCPQTNDYFVAYTVGCLVARQRRHANIDCYISFRWMGAIRAVCVISMARVDAPQEGVPLVHIVDVLLLRGRQGSRQQLCQ